MMSVRLALFSRRVLACLLFVLSVPQKQNITQQNKQQEQKYDGEVMTSVCEDVSEGTRVRSRIKKRVSVHGGEQTEQRYGMCTHQHVHGC